MVRSHELSLVVARLLKLGTPKESLLNYMLRDIQSTQHNGIILYIHCALYCVYIPNGLAECVHYSVYLGGPCIHALMCMVGHAANALQT